MWATRLRTNKFGHFMVLNGTNIFFITKAKVHNENQGKISNILNFKLKK